MPLRKKYKSGVKVKINDMAINEMNMNDQQRIDFLERKILEAEIYSNNSADIIEWNKEIEFIKNKSND